MFDDESQVDRLTTLPPELLEHIFRLISDPKDMVRCLLVHRRITEAVQISFKNIRSLAIGYTSNTTSLHTINNSRVDDIAAVVKQLWDRAATITTLKLTGKWHLSLDEVLLPRSLENGLRYSPHALTELELELDYGLCQPTRTILVPYILKAVSNSLEKFSLSIRGLRALYHTGIIKALGGCMRLRVLRLDHLHMTRQSIGNVCFRKLLENVTISGPPLSSWTDKADILTGIIESVDTKIECLSLDLKPDPLTGGEVEVYHLLDRLDTVRPLPHLIELSLISYRSYLDTPAMACRMRELLLPALCLTFPAMQLLRIDNRLVEAETHWYSLCGMHNFFDRVLPSLTVERKVRRRFLPISCIYLSSSRYESSSLTLLLVMFNRYTMTCTL